MENSHLYNLKIKSYLTHEEYSYFSKCLSLSSPSGTRTKHIQTDSIKNKHDSKIRSYSNLYDLIHSNYWDWFGTFTFKSSALRHDYYRIVKSMNRFFRYVKEKTLNDINYLYVIEEHKKGGYHIHVLLSGVSADDMVEALDPEGKPIFINGKKIFHYKHYKKGFQSFSLIENQAATGNYIMKYISKDIGKNKRAYYCSKGLNRPITEFKFDSDFYITSKLPTVSEDAKLSAYKNRVMGYDRFIIKESF